MNDDFKGNWICDKDFKYIEPINIFHKDKDKFELPEESKKLNNLHFLFRKNVYIKEYKRSYIRITADDYYKLYINGRFVCQGPAPSYHFNYYYNEVDITEYLNPGNNAICAHVYYQGLINRVWNSGDLRCGLIADIIVDDKCISKTDDTWKYFKLKAIVEGNKVGYDTQFMENYDSRLQQTNWLNVEFDDSLWEQACIKECTDYKFSENPVNPISVYRVKPKTIIEKKSERTVFYDFGQELTGNVEIKAEGKIGQQIVILCGEELQEDGSNTVRYKMRCNCEYKEVWTLDEGLNVLEQYDYKAFRYVQLIYDEGVEIISLEAVVRHYPFDDNNCIFESSNKKLNIIWKMLKNGVKYGCQEVYVDCPTREKGQYLGDLVITAQAHFYLTGDLSLYKKALIDFSNSTKICKGMMAVAPGSLMQEIADYSFQYPILLLRYYQHSGDIELLRKLMPIAQNIIQYYKKYQREDGLLDNVIETNLVDWPQNMRDGYEYDLNGKKENGCHNVINAFYLYAIKIVEEISDILGTRHENEYDRLKKAFRKVFYDEETRLFVDCIGSKHSSLHANVIAVVAGLHDEKDSGVISKFIEAKGLSCGVYIAYYVLLALAELSRYDLVYNFIIQESKNSWYNMIREGATTCFEVWGKDSKWNTSLCHPWASGVIPIFIEEILGVKPGKPGWKGILIESHMPEELKGSKIYFTLNVGEIIKFYYDKGVYSYEF